MKKIKETIKFIKKVYLSDNRPWIISTSFGKDSTAVLMLTFLALQELKNENNLNKKVYVINADTQVDNPIVEKHVVNSINHIKNKIKELDLPVEVHRVKPKVEETFWSCLIGKGYLPPISQLRWCTDRLKIRPTTEFIESKIDDYEQVVILLGVRKGESDTRDKIMDKHKVENKVLRLHSSFSNAYVFAPIKDFTTEDVWNTLLYNGGETPWGTNNNDLHELYADSNENSALDTLDKETSRSDGNSRWGCWTCTVIKKDKSLSGFIESGETWLEP
ncbi:MAG: DNA phosphorothioation system sulfurtransferase DndC, partial [archaeon]